MHGYLYIYIHYMCNIYIDTWGCVYANSWLVNGKSEWKRRLILYSHFRTSPYRQDCNGNPDQAATLQHLGCQAARMPLSFCENARNHSFLHVSAWNCSLPRNMETEQTKDLGFNDLTNKKIVCFLRDIEILGSKNWDWNIETRQTQNRTPKMVPSNRSFSSLV